MTKSPPEIDRALYEDVCANVRTVDERGIVYAGIESILDGLYRSGGDILSLIEALPRAVVQPLKQRLVHKGASPESVKQYIEGLQQALNHLQILTLEIAFDPTEETVAILTVWIRKNIGNAVIMDFSVDRTLLAGVRLSFEGRYKEINLARIIEDAIRQQPDAIMRLLEKT